MKRKITIFIVIILSICVTNTIYKNVEKRKQYIENYSISSSFVVFDTEYDFSPYENKNIIMNLETGKMEPINPATDNFTLSEVETFWDGENIYILKNNKWERISVPNLRVCSKPIKNGDSLFFIAEKQMENNSNSLYHIWKYVDGEFSLFHESSVSSDSLCIYDDILFFEQNHSRIMAKNINTGEVEFIVQGKNFCWKEPCETFFFETISNELAIYEIDSRKIEVLHSEIKMSGAPIYDRDENILLLLTYNNGRDWGDIIPEITIYYLDKNEYIYLPEYFNEMGWKYFNSALIFSLYKFYLI